MIIESMFRDPFDGLDPLCRADECSCPTVFRFLGISSDYVHCVDGRWVAEDMLNRRTLVMAESYSSAASEWDLMPRRFVFADQRSVDLFLQSKEPALRLVRELVTVARAVSAPQVLTLPEIFSMASLMGVVGGFGSSIDALHGYKVHGANDDRAVSPLYADGQFQRAYSVGDGLPSLVSALSRSAQRSRAVLRWPNTLDRERRTIHIDDWLDDNLLVVPVDSYLPAFIAGSPRNYSRSERLRELWGNRSHVVDCYEPVRAPSSSKRQGLVPNPRRLPRASVPFDVMSASNGELSC